MEHVVSEYLKVLNIPVSTSWCKKQIRSHPDYPSLLSISDTLERLGIRHQAARIPVEETTELAFPYLLQMDDRSGGLKLIKNERDRLPTGECLILIDRKTSGLDLQGFENPGGL